MTNERIIVNNTTTKTTTRTTTKTTPFYPRSRTDTNKPRKTALNTPNTMTTRRRRINSSTTLKTANTIIEEPGIIGEGDISGSTGTNATSVDYNSNDNDMIGIYITKILNKKKSKFQYATPQKIICPSLLPTEKDFYPLLSAHNMQYMKEILLHTYSTIQQNATNAYIFVQTKGLIESIRIEHIIGLLWLFPQSRSASGNRYDMIPTWEQTIDASLSLVLLLILLIGLGTSHAMITSMNITWNICILFLSCVVDIQEMIHYCIPPVIKNVCRSIRSFTSFFEGEVMFVNELRGREWNSTLLEDRLLLILKEKKNGAGNTGKDIVPCLFLKDNNNFFVDSDGRDIRSKTRLHQKVVNYALCMRLDSMEPDIINPTTSSTTNTPLRRQQQRGTNRNRSFTSSAITTESADIEVVDCQNTQTFTDLKSNSWSDDYSNNWKNDTDVDSSDVTESLWIDEKRIYRHYEPTLHMLQASESSSQDHIGLSNSSESSISTLALSSATNPQHTSTAYNSKENKPEVDFNWLDVGTRLGIHLLKSEPVQRLMDHSSLHNDTNKHSSSPMLTVNASPLPFRGTLLETDSSVMANARRPPIHSVWSHYDPTIMNCNTVIPDSLLLPSYSHNENLPDQSLPVITARDMFTPGIKMAVTLSSLITTHHTHNQKQQPLLMTTVITCNRIYIPGYRVPDDTHPETETTTTKTNALEIQLILDHAFLRNAQFAQIQIRIPDSIPTLPKHSKYPIGSCIASKYGIGILVGWRYYDDIHVIRSLWSKRGMGSGLAYLNRDVLFDVVEAAVGLEVVTRLGQGIVMGYINGGPEFLKGQYLVQIIETCRHKNAIIKLHRHEIISCPSAKLIPVIEYVREAVSFQIQYDSYQAAVDMTSHDCMWEVDYLKWSDGVDIIFRGLVTAVEEIPDYNLDNEMNSLLTNVINFLERLELGKTTPKGTLENSMVHLQQSFAASKDTPLFDPLPTKEEGEGYTSSTQEEDHKAGLSLWNNIFSGIFPPTTTKFNDACSATQPLSNNDDTNSSFTSSTITMSSSQNKHTKHTSYSKALSVLRILLRALAIARVDATKSSKPNLQLGLSIACEILLFFRSVLKIRQKNVSEMAHTVRARTWKLWKETLIPIQKVLSNIGRGVEERLQQHEAIARARFARFFDLILHDERMLHALDYGDWDLCLSRLERAIIKSRILDADSCVRLRKSAFFIYHALAPRRETAGGDCNNAKSMDKKLLWVAKAVKWLATPRRSILKILSHDAILSLIERILVRVFKNNSSDIQTINIYASTFHSFHHLMLLGNISIAGKLWIPLLDAADEEFAWAVSKMPDNDMRDIGVALSKLFSLGVANIRCLQESPGNWLDFLLKEEAIELIQKLDMKLVLSIESFCQDIKNTMGVLPYYASIDQDILNLLDEVDLREFLKEASEAILDKHRFLDYLREKCQLAIDRFLKYLPKMSIPVERREIGDGWIITCRTSDGGALKLSEVSLCRDNMVCQVIGSENLFSPVVDDIKTSTSYLDTNHNDNDLVYSVLDDIRELIINAQKFGSWIDPNDAHSYPMHPSSPLNGIPLTDVLSCAIDLWKNLEIDDDELMEIAVRDVSHQIQLRAPQETDTTHSNKRDHQRSNVSSPSASNRLLFRRQSSSANCFSNNEEDFEFFPRLRFNPRVDPTVLYLAIRDMTIRLEDFIFRVEMKEKRSICDPVFQGAGTLTVNNVSIKLRVECRKEKTVKNGLEVSLPVLQLQELDVRLGSVKFRFKESGLGWFFNTIVEGFSDSITEIVEVNLKEQIVNQIHDTLEKLNSVIEGNPDLFLSILGITINDLDENIVWV